MNYQLLSHWPMHDFQIQLKSLIRHKYNPRGTDIIQWGTNIAKWGLHIYEWGLDIAEWGSNIAECGKNVGAIYMIPLCWDATKRGISIVLMYWKLPGISVAVHALAKLFRSEYFKVIKFNFSRRRIDLFKHIKVLSRAIQRSSRQHFTCGSNY